MPKNRFSAGQIVTPLCVSLWAKRLDLEPSTTRYGRGAGSQAEARCIGMALDDR
jgi:hypothetical protein